MEACSPDKLCEQVAQGAAHPRQPRQPVHAPNVCHWPRAACTAGADWAQTELRQRDSCLQMPLQPDMQLAGHLAAAVSARMASRCLPASEGRPASAHAFPTISAGSCSAALTLKSPATTDLHCHCIKTLPARRTPRPHQQAVGGRSDSLLGRHAQAKLNVVGTLQAAAMWQTKLVGSLELHTEDTYLQLERACQQSQCQAEAAAGSRQSEPPSCRHASRSLKSHSHNRISSFILH